MTATPAAVRDITLGNAEYESRVAERCGWGDAADESSAPASRSVIIYGVSVYIDPDGRVYLAQRGQR